MKLRNGFDIEIEPSTVESRGSVNGRKEIGVYCKLADPIRRSSICIRTRAALSIQAE